MLGETGLFDDDTTCDVRDSFMDYLDEGNTPEEDDTKDYEERKKILIEFKEKILSCMDFHL